MNKRGPKELLVPSTFSFIENPESVAEFIQKAESVYKKRRSIFVNMEQVKAIDHGAITALLAVIHQFKMSGIQFNGNFPSEQKPALILKESGFMYELFEKKDDKFRYKMGEVNQIFTRAEKDFASRLAKLIIQDATKTIWGIPRRCPGLYRVIVELMHNTHDHAAGERKGHERWWLSVNQDEKNKKVVFTFIDYGMGILTSLNNKPEGRTLFDRLGAQSSHKHLESLFTTKNHESSSKKRGRGWGLYSIKQAMDRNQISKLHVITNNAFGNLAAGEYRRLNAGFSGTLYSWELCYDSVNLP